MNDKWKFYITDVFGAGRYSGNQLATFLDSASIPDEEMQQIAREINFSETTFILSDKPKNGGYDVRIFTPDAELDFAGHPTLGTAYIIQKHIIRKPVEQVTLNLKVGQVPVRFTDDGLLWMEQVQPKFGDSLPVEKIAPVLNLEGNDIDVNRPIQEVSTGLPTIIVPLKSADALKRIRIDRERYDTLIQETWASVILAFCTQGYTDDQTLGVRVFPVALGISEDPATGSGNGCLAAYLIEQQYFGTDAVDLVVGQGYEIGRPSSIHLRAKKENDAYQIQVGGRVISIADGWWG